MASSHAVARKPRRFGLTEEGRRDLEKLVRTPSTAAGLSRRARAVLLMADGVSGAEVARRCGYTTVQVCRIRRRVTEEGIPGIYERPRSGRPPVITTRKRAQVVAITLKKPEGGLSQWSTREIARRTGVSHTTVHRIWKAHDLKAHRLETFKFITDPQELSRSELPLGETVGARAVVTNAGGVEADEVVQLYVRDLVGSVTRPGRELKGFQRIRLRPGESRWVEFEIGPNDLSFYDRDMRLYVEPGEFHVWIRRQLGSRIAGRVQARRKMIHCEART